MNPPMGRLATGLLALLFVEALVLLLPGHLAISGHEVDAFHAADIALRLAEGERQHVDFLTPLGILSTLPVAAFARLGFGIHTAFVLANIAAALALLPAILRVAPRFGRFAMPFGALCVVILTAVIHGGYQGGVSISMYYNRWGWIAAFLVATMLVLRDETARQGDGLLTGLLLGATALIKITIFAALAPVVLLVALIDRDWRFLFACGLAGLGVAAAATLAFGPELWPAYLHDLRVVAGSHVRPQPGIGYAEVLAAPANLPGTLLLLAAVILLRAGAEAREGLVLLILLPAFAYITYQNWGNDPKYLILLGFLALVWSGRVTGAALGLERRTAFLMIAAASFTLVGPVLITLATSPIRNALADTSGYMPMLSDPRHAGLMVERARAESAQSSVIDTDLMRVPPEPLRFAGVTFPPCTAQGGYLGRMRHFSERLVEAGFAGKRVAVIDVNTSLFRIGPFAKVPHIQPWYYGGADGIAGADAILVPTCPLMGEGRPIYLAAIEQLDIRWKEAFAEPHFRVFVPE